MYPWLRWAVLVCFTLLLLVIALIFYFFLSFFSSDAAHGVRPFHWRQRAGRERCLRGEKPLLSCASLLHCLSASLLHCFSASLLHCFTASLLHCFSASLLHCFTASLLHCFTANPFILTPPLPQFTPKHHNQAANTARSVNKALGTMGDKGAVAVLLSRSAGKTRE
jgi:hypothetical protein